MNHLNGIPAASHELEQYEEVAVSIVTWMEVLAGADDAGEEATIREFLSRFKVQPLERAAAERAIKIRRQHKLKLPDAIIWATAWSEDFLWIKTVSKTARRFRKRGGCR